MSEKELYVTRSSMPEFDEYVCMIKDIWDSHWLTNMGKFHMELEAKLKKYLQCSNISLFCNGHMALELVIQAMHLSGEVITTPFTFASTTHAIVRNGLKPIFCDISINDYTIDVTKIEKLITDKTTAIIPVHVYGNICNTKEIDRLAKKYNLKVIYDAAHAFGVKVNGESIANYGDASVFSFHATKVFNTIEGGAVAYSNPKLEQQLYKLKNFGIVSEEVIDEIGSNAKMNEFQAAMGICNLRHINDEILKRKCITDQYRKRLSGISGMNIMNAQCGVDENYAYFPVRFEEDTLGYTRDDVYNELKKNKIFARKYFYPLTNNYECYKDRYDKLQTPVAECVAKSILTLPIYADMTVKEVNRVCDIILEMSK